MKKSILFLFALFPILASCNNNERGFVNPFPDDTYSPIGFKFGTDEIIKRYPLTTPENELLIKTINSLPQINSKLILSEDIHIHMRDYTRAFAGVFKEGYDASNMKYDEETHSFYQKQEESQFNEITRVARKKTTRNVKSTLDYSYGQNISETDYKSITFLGIQDKDEKTKIVYNEATDISSAKVAIEVNYEIIDQEDKQISAIKKGSIEDKEEEPEEVLLPCLNIYQSISPLTTINLSGVNSANDIILIEEHHDPYIGEGEPGEYIMPDGRKYRAVNNSLSVTRLKKETDTSEERSIGDYYLVASARTYTETAITSKVIQPNIPIEFLKKSIVINYSEEIHEFSNVNTKISDEEPFEGVEVTE